MAETLKIVYIVILLVSICLVVVNGISIYVRCASTDECYTTFKFSPRGSMRCVEGYCKHLKDFKVKTPLQIKEITPLLLHFP